MKNIRKNTLWRVPTFCVAASLITYYFSMYVIGRFALVIQSDGTIATDFKRQFFIYGIMFVVTLIIGGMFVFRNMTKKEIFISASIMVVFSILIDIIQWLYTIIVGSNIFLSLYVSQIFYWSNFISHILSLTNIQFEIGVILAQLAPYLFVLFGRKSK